MIKPKIIISLFILLLIILPFGLFDNRDEINAVELSDSTIGYYQSTTCKISLLEFYLENLNSDKDFYINENNYADLNCFGKITGVDKVNDSFMVSIGTNTSGNLIIQSLIWLLFFMLVPSHKKNNKFSSKLLIFIPLIFIFQYIAESRFYNRTNFLYNNELSFSNYYLIGNLIFYTFITLVIKDEFQTRYNNLINFIPFIFLISGTFSGMNLNIYLIILCFFGVLNFSINQKIKIFDLLYFVLSIGWILNLDQNDFFFDGDKLRGFTNTVLTRQSQIFWIIIFYLSLKGLIFLINSSVQYFNFELFIRNSLIAGSLTCFLGIIGALYPLGNFLNFYIFGQNKRGMKEFSSIAGNTWRGFAPSAESVGEFYGFIIILVFLYIIKYKKIPAKKYILLLVPIIYGLYRSNNFASISSILLIILLSILVRSYLFEKYKKIIIIGLILFITGGFYYFTQLKTYEYLSTELVYEATLHQNFYPRGDAYSSYLQVEKKMIERDLNSLLIEEENSENASSTYKFLVSLLTVNFNIPLVPNIVAFISMISLIINRTEMWGIFIAKYNPSFVEVVIGSGPLQLNKYLYEHNIRLDVPKEKLESLYLPHSSVLDLYIYFGMFTFLMVGYGIYLVYKNFNQKNIFVFLSIFLILNIIKSDSILYIHSAVLVVFTFLGLEKIKDPDDIE